MLSALQFPAPPPPVLDMGRIRALVCEPRGQLRQGVRIALNNIGIRTITEAGSFVACHKACGEAEYDILIVNQDIESNDTGVLIREVRQARLGRDPFVITVMLLAAPDEPRVRAALDCGADDLLLVPFSPDQLMTRIRHLAERRKPFVVTHDYMGPDRRTAPRPGASSANQFEVPNPVRARGLIHPPEKYAAAVHEAMAALAAERVKRLAAGIEFECKILVVACRDSGPSGDQVLRSLAKMEGLGDELADRIKTHLGHTTDLVDAFLMSVRKLKGNPSSIAAHDVESLFGLGRKISGTYTSR